MTMHEKFLMARMILASQTINQWIRNFGRPSAERMVRNIIKKSYTNEFASALRTAFGA